MMGPEARQILAFDSAGAACSAAVWVGGHVAARRSEAMNRGQSERLVPMIGEVMDEARIEFASLDTVAVTSGPGGFTGVRIGLATAKGLALACNCPLLGVTNFEAVAAAVPEVERSGRSMVVLLDAKRSDLYLQNFAPGGAPLCLPQCVDPAKLNDLVPSGPLLVVGSGVDQALPGLKDRVDEDVLVSSSSGQADAAVVAAIAAGRQIPEAGSSAPAPLYLRPPDVTEPDRGRRKS